MWMWLKLRRRPPAGPAAITTIYAATAISASSWSSLSSSSSSSSWSNRRRIFISLQWRHNGHDSVSNHQPHDCLPNRLFRRRSKKTSKLRTTGICAGNSPETGEFPAQKASNAENVFIWWRHQCPACRTYEIATRFWVVVICPIIKCLTVLEFSFILFDLCLFITIFNFILNYVLIVTFWIFTYHKIWILLIIYCFIWNYWIVYFLTCLEVFWSVVS